VDPANQTNLDDNLDLTDTADVDAEADVGDELTSLKQRATLMGISFSNNIKVDTLRERISAKLAGEPAPADPEAAPTVVLEGASTTVTKSSKPTWQEELVAKSMALVRCRITNMDPKKKDLPGEVITVGNEYIGTVSKFIPFGEATDDGYHIPFVLYQNLEERRFQHITTSRDRQTRQIQTKTTWAKEFAIEVLPQLTQEELDRLGQAQIAAGSVDGPQAAEYMA